ncbi:MAG TPA: serine/threonine-protein kinase [Candidatus Binatia bacterium]|nr:serine/threonine-protein kinase [Candidatus Binatia bacterium]
MGTTPLCPSCGKPLAANAPKGLCQECLLKAGFPTGTETGGKAPPFNPPTVAELAGKFPQLEIIELIGSGGMGAVYKARQKELDRIVALKILPPGIGHDAAFADRFAREARALARLNHPNIITLYEFGRADGLFFFLMEFVDGVNLRQLLNARQLSAREALAIVPQICDALQYAHDQGIVHRDIKPENILLDRKGRVKVADFGLARLMVLEAEESAQGSSEEISASATLTEAGKVMGTPDYMAPEQAEKPTEVDHRADIYSLGVVLYQMLTGELPGRRIEPPSKKVHLDVRLDEVVLRALEREPNRRYQQASQVKTDVETIAQTPAPRKSEAWKVAAVIAAGVFVLLAIPFGLVLLYLLIPSMKGINPGKARPATVATVAVEGMLFGPEIERVLYSATARPIRVLDLDRGEEIEVPAAREKGTEEEFFFWISERGVDLMGQSHRTAWTLTTSLKLASLEGTSWADITPEKLREAVMSGTNTLAHEGTVFGYDQYHIKTNTALPMSFAFQTRQGGLGVLQIVAFTREPGGVKLRFKLVQAVSEIR